MTGVMYEYVDGLQYASPAAQLKDRKQAQAFQTDAMGLTVVDPLWHPTRP